MYIYQNLWNELTSIEESYKYKRLFVIKFVRNGIIA